MKKNKTINLEDWYGCKELIVQLNYLQKRIYTVGFSALDNSIGLIPDEVYKTGVRLFLDGRSTEMIVFLLNSLIKKNELNGVTLIRARIIVDSFNYLFSTIGRRVNIILYAHLPIRFVLEKYPDLYEFYSDNNSIRQFIVMAEVYSNKVYPNLVQKDELHDFIMRNFKSKGDFRFLSEILILKLGIEQTSIVIITMGCPLKEKILLNLPPSLLSVAMDFMLNDSLIHHSTTSARNALLCILKEGYKSKSLVQHIIPNMPLPIGSSVSLIRTQHLKSLEEFAQELFLIYPQPFDGFENLTTFILQSSEALFLIAYELFLSGVDRSTIIDTINKYLINSEYEPIRKIKCYLFAVFVTCLSSSENEAKLIINTLITG